MSVGNEQLDDEGKRNNSSTILCTKKEPLNGLHKVVYGKQLWKACCLQRSVKLEDFIKDRCKQHLNSASRLFISVRSADS